jgi:hypothetical protein
MELILYQGCQMVYIFENQKSQFLYYLEDHKKVQRHYANQTNANRPNANRPNANRPNANRPNANFTISDPMSPGRMSPTPNVA